MRGKRSLRIGDFKPGVLLQPLNITTLLLQDKEAKLKRRRLTTLCVSPDKSWQWPFEDSGWSNPADFLGSLCPALLWGKCGWVGKCCKVPAVFWERRAPGPRGAGWDLAPHWLRLHGRCRSCWLSSKTELESYRETTEISLHRDFCHLLLRPQSKCWTLCLPAHPMVDKSSQQHSNIAEGSPQAIF